MPGTSRRHRGAADIAVDNGLSALGRRGTAPARTFHTFEGVSVCRVFRARAIVCARGIGPSGRGLSSERVPSRRYWCSACEPTATCIRLVGSAMAITAAVTGGAGFVATELIHQLLVTRLPARPDMCCTRAQAACVWGEAPLQLTLQARRRSALHQAPRPLLPGQGLECARHGAQQE